MFVLTLITSNVRNIKMITQNVRSVSQDISSRMFGSTVESNLYVGAVFLVLSLLGLELMINLELIRKSQVKKKDFKIKADQDSLQDSEFESSQLWWNRNKYPTSQNVQIS